MSAAPNFETLFQIEEPLVNGAATLLATWLPAGVTVILPEDPTIIATPCVQVRFQYNGEGDHSARYTWEKAQTVSLPCHYLGQFQFTIKAYRVGTVAVGHTYAPRIRGLIRGLMAHFEGTWNNTVGVLTYGKITFCKEGQSSYSVDSENNLDISELNFEIQYTLNRDAYPAF